MRRSALMLCMVMSMLFFVSLALPVWAGPVPDSLELKYRYSEETGSPANLSDGDTLLLYSNRRNGEGGSLLMNRIYLTITTTSDSHVKIEKSGGSSVIELLNKDLVASESFVPVFNVSSDVYEVAAVLNVKSGSIPAKGLDGASLEITQFGKEKMNIKLAVVTLPTSVAAQPKVITLGPGSLTYPDGKTGSTSGTWYPILNGAHYSMDSNAGPLRYILDLVPGGGVEKGSGGAAKIAISNEKGDHGGKEGDWYFLYDNTKLDVPFEKVTAVFEFTYADSPNTKKELHIDFLYSDAETSVNSLAVVPVTGKTMPRLIDSSTERVYFNVYANRNSKDEWIINGGLTGSAGTFEGDYLQFTVDPVQAASVVYDADHGYYLERGDIAGSLYNGKFSVKVAYRADTTKLVNLSYAYVSENSEIKWVYSDLTKTFTGVAFSPDPAFPGSPEPIEATVYMSPTSGYYSGVLDLATALEYDPSVEAYEAKTWKVESKDTSVATASISKNKLTIKPVAFGETSVMLTTYDEMYGVSLKLKVEMPSYDDVLLTYKIDKETISETKSVNWTNRNSEIASIVYDLQLQAGKTYPFKVKYKNSFNADTAFDMPQGNGYWYSENSAYVTVTNTGSVRAIGETLHGETIKVFFVDNRGYCTIELRITVKAKTTAVSEWASSLALTYKSGKNTGSANVGTGGSDGRTVYPASALQIGLHDKAYTLKATANQTNASGKSSTKKPKVYYQSEMPEFVHVSAKGVLTPIQETTTPVKIWILSKDSGAGVKEGYFYVSVKAPAP